MIGRQSSIRVDPFSPLHDQCVAWIVRMVISPGSSHSFRILVVWHDVVVVGELFVADGTLPVLLDNLPIKRFSHFSRRPEFSISSWVMRIVDTLHADPYQPGPRLEFPAAAGKRFVK